MKRLYYFAKRPVCREIGVLRFIASIGMLAYALCWAIPALQKASDTVLLSGVRAVVARQVGAAQLAAERAGSGVPRFCPSNDGLQCTHTGWSQGWIAFQDRDSDGLRDRTERVLFKAGAIPLTLEIVGDLNDTTGALCWRAPRGTGCVADERHLPQLSVVSRPRRS